MLIARFEEWKSIDVMCFYDCMSWILLAEFWENDLSGPFKEGDSQSYDDSVSLQSRRPKPCSQRYLPLNTALEFGHHFLYILGKFLECGDSL